jgi:hypothetical protein
MMYATPGDELDFFIFNGQQVAYDHVKKGGFYLISVIGGNGRNAGNSTTYGKNGIASLFKFCHGPNEFGNCLFQDEQGDGVLLKEFMILNGNVKFYSQIIVQ